jgi:hypothetical protein
VLQQIEAQSAALKAKQIEQAQTIRRDINARCAVLSEIEHFCGTLITKILRSREQSWTESYTASSVGSRRPQIASGMTVATLSDKRDGQFLWHYTKGVHISKILEDGVIKPANTLRRLFFEDSQRCCGDFLNRGIEIDAKKSVG